MNKMLIIVICIITSCGSPVRENSDHIVSLQDSLKKWELQGNPHCALVKVGERSGFIEVKITIKYNAAIGTDKAGDIVIKCLEFIQGEVGKNNCDINGYYSQLTSFDKDSHVISICDLPLKIKFH